MVKRGSVTASEASTAVSATNRSNKPTTKSKDKTGKSDKDSDLLKAAKLHDRDVHNGTRTTDHYPNVTNARSLGTARGGKAANVKGGQSVQSSSTAAIDKDTLLDQLGIHRKTHMLDPTLLARGMTSRFVGSRVAGYIKTLSPEDIEKDLHHMEAYRCACISYSQKYFAYINQEYMIGLIPIQTEKTMNLLSIPSISTSQTGTPIMPSKIDPDEEKRLTELRKKIAASEFKREGIESEYVSYRAHFVFQCHRLLLTRKVVNGQLKLLQDLIQKKGSVLAIQRVMCSILKDIVHGLQSRGTLNTIESSSISDSDMNATEHVIEDNSDGKQSDQNALWEAWIALESQLQTAEAAMGTILPPKELLVVKHALAITSSSTPSNSLSTVQDLTHMNGMSRRSRSPSKSRGQKDDDDSAINGATKKKAKNDKDSKGISTISFDKGKQSKLNDADDIPAEKDLPASGKRNSLSLEDRCIPWPCLSHPRTPMNIPLLASLLSEASSRYAAYGVGNVMGKSPFSMIWLEKNLPKALQIQEEEDRLNTLRDEVSALKADLEREVQMNHNLQKQAISNRRHSDVLCSSMCILRTETEALVERHNIILDTPEVKDRASTLFPCSITEEFYDDGYLEEDADMDDEIGAEFDHAEQGEDSDSVEGAGIGDEEDEIDAEPEEDETNKRYCSAIQESTKDSIKRTDKDNSNKRSFDMYTINQVTGTEERKRRRP